MWTVSAPVSAAAPAPLSSAARRSASAIRSTGSTAVGPLVDTIAQLTGTDQDRCAGVDHGLLRHPRRT